MLISNWQTIICYVGITVWFHFVKVFYSDSKYQVRSKGGGFNVRPGSNYQTFITDKRH